MTISSTTVVTRTNTNGVTHTFNFGHPFQDPDDLLVYLVTISDWSIALQTRDTHYTVSENGNEDEVGGSITFINELQVATAPATGKVCVILRKPDLVQDYNPSTVYEATQGEAALDRIYQVLQYLKLRSDRSIHLNDAYADATVEIPDVDERAGKALVFDDDGNLTVGLTGESVLDGAEEAQEAAEAAASTATAQASTATTAASAAVMAQNLAEDWAVKVNGIVNGEDYSSKAWAIGGTDVTSTSGRGAAKEWATKTLGLVDTDEGSAKAYAVGGTGVSATANRGAAKEWATKTNGAVDTSDYSAKAYAVGGSGVSGAAGAAKEWAEKTDGAVNGGGDEFSAKAWAIGGTGVDDQAGRGSAKAWAVEPEDQTVDGTGFSAFHWATKAAASADAAAAASENPALTFAFDSSTTDADPGDGEFRINHATYASATELYFDNEDAFGNSVTGWLDFFDDTLGTTKGLIVIRDVSDATAFAIYLVTGSVVDGTGYRKVPVTAISTGAGVFDGLVSVMFIPVADVLGDLASTSNGLGASLIGIEDAGGYYAGTDLEAALQEIGQDITALDQAIVLKGVWDASSGSFPGSGAAQAGWKYIVSVGGTVDGVVFVANDTIAAIADNASTSTYADNWHKFDHTDQVLSVDGQTGAVDLSSVYQPLNATLTSLTSASANGVSLITSANYATMRGLLDLEAGTDFYSITAADALLAAKVPTTRQVISGGGLTGGGTLSADLTLAVGAGTGITVDADAVAIDKASDANVRAAASNKVITSDLIESASAPVALSDAATVAVDWDAGVNFTLTVTANRVIGNPTNGQPGTWRTIYVVGNDATDRTITFGNQFLGEVPTITDADSTRGYLLTIYCLTTSHFVVSSKKALGT